MSLASHPPIEWKPDKRAKKGSNNTRRIIITELLPLDDCVDEFNKALTFAARKGKDITVIADGQAFLIQPTRIEVD